MAITQNPLIGRASGTFGGAVFSKLYNKNIVRSKPVSISDAKSPAQLSQRAKFTAAHAFLSQIADFIALTYAPTSEERSGYSSAMSHFLRNNMTFVDPDWLVDFPSVILTAGPHPGLQSLSVVDPSCAGFDIVWDNSSPPAGANDADIVSFVILIKTEGNPIRYIEDETRNTESTSLILPASLAGETYHLFAFVTNPVGTIVSDSQYIGSGILTA